MGYCSTSLDLDGAWLAERILPDEEELLLPEASDNGAREEERGRRFRLKKSGESVRSLSRVGLDFFGVGKKSGERVSSFRGVGVGLGTLGVGGVPPHGKGVSKPMFPLVPFHGLVSTSPVHWSRLA